MKRSVDVDAGAPRAWYGSPWTTREEEEAAPPQPPDDKHTTGAHAGRAPKDAAALQKVGVVLGRFCPPHLGHLHLVEEAFTRCGLLYVLYPARGFDSDPGYLHQYGVNRAFSPWADVAQIYVGPDDPRDPAAPGFAARYAAQVRERVPNATTLFSSDDRGGAAALAQALGVEHVLIDPARKAHPVSGARIRADFWGNFRFVAPEARTFYALQVAVVGVEGSGKSTLARELRAALDAAVVDDALLAEAQRTGAVPSARAFAAALFDSFAARDRAAAACDSGVVVDESDRPALRMWAERLRVPLDEHSAQLAADARTDLVLYCEPDFPFTAPPGREHDPAARAAFDATLRAFYDAPVRAARTVHIRGEGRARVEAAVDAVRAAQREKLARILTALAV